MAAIICGFILVVALVALALFDRELRKMRRIK
jgi:hypothetical protein